MFLMSKKNREMCEIIFLEESDILELFLTGCVKLKEMWHEEFDSDDVLLSRVTGKINARPRKHK